MRRPALLVVVVAALALTLSLGGVGLGGVATAQPSPYGAGDERAVPATSDTQPRNTGANPQPMPWARPPEDGSNMRMPQQLDSRPSGFWTSNRPARGGAYRWRMMAVGAGVLALTMFFVLRLLLKTARASTAAR